MIREGHDLLRGYPDFTAFVRRWFHLDGIYNFAHYADFVLTSHLKISKMNLIRLTEIRAFTAISFISVFRLNLVYGNEFRSTRIAITHNIKRFNLDVLSLHTLLNQTNHVVLSQHLPANPIIMK